MQHKKTSKTCNMNETCDNHKTGKLIGNAAGFRLSYGTNSGICFIFFKISAKFYSKYKTPTHFSWYVLNHTP